MKVFTLLSTQEIDLLLRGLDALQDQTTPESTDDQAIEKLMVKLHNRRTRAK